MYNNRIFLLSFLFIFPLLSACFAQNLNWKRVNTENNHLIFANIGFNFGATAALGYGHRLNTSLPILLNAEFSIPFGNRPLDDFKSKIGGQTQLLRMGNFSASIKIYGLFRRYESNLVRLESFGSETGAVLGYYKRKWYVAAEVDFDKAITTHLVHSSALLENSPTLRNGWYIPTGGNFFYGIQTGLSFGKNDLNLSVGRSVTQDFKTAPTIPFYAQLGVNRRF